MKVKEEIYENGVKFFKLRKFLWWEWWSQFAEGGSFTEPMGKLKEIRYKEY
jgi:hypothetical protein